MMLHDWYRFDEETFRRQTENFIRLISMHEYLIIVLRTNGKVYTGKLKSEGDIKSDGVTLHNRFVASHILYNMGPPKKFTVIQLPKFEVRVADKQLPFR